MRLSVIIPVYNAAPYLAECLESILTQLPMDAEVICVDDGSTDNSAAILESFARREFCIKILHQENAGQGAARNRGLQQAQGDFIYFADVDDALTGNYSFAQLIEEMTRNNLDVLFFDAAIRFDSPELADVSRISPRYYIRRHKYPDVCPGVDLFAKFVAHHEFLISPPLMLLRRSFLDENKLRFPEGCYYEDNVFTQHVMLEAKRASHRAWQFYLRKVHDGSTVTQVPTLRHLRGRLACYQNVFDLLQKKGWSPQVHSALCDRLRIHKHYLRRTVRENPELIAKYQGQLTSDEQALVRSVQDYPLFDKMADVFQCFKDRGLVYTMRRILFGRGERL